MAPFMREASRYPAKAGGLLRTFYIDLLLEIWAYPVKCFGDKNRCSGPRFQVEFMSNFRWGVWLRRIDSFLSVFQLPLLIIILIRCHNHSFFKKAVYSQPIQTMYSRIVVQDYS